MFAIDTLFTDKAELFGIHRECVKIDVQPIECVAFYPAILHKVVKLAIISGCKVNIERAIFIFKYIFNIFYTISVFFSSGIYNLIPFL